MLHHLLQTCASKWATSKRRSGGDVLQHSVESHMPQAPKHYIIPISRIGGVRLGIELRDFGVELSNTDLSRPRWPNFVKAMISAADNPLGPPSVMGFYNPLLIRNPLVTNSVNASNSSIIRSFGAINLTWSDPPKLACDSRIPLNQISHSLPLSINLTSFAHSVFQLSPSTIILLFNCAGSVSHDFLQKDSPACHSFAINCNLWKEGPNCYQYTPHSKEVNLSQAMKSFDCANATFFVVPDLSLPASQWSPGLIQLNWSTDNPQIASYIGSCVDCLQTNGACGYGDEDNFQCYCANCSATVEIPESPGDCANCTATVKSPGCGILCRIRAKMAIGLIGAAIMFILVTLCYCRKKTKNLFRLSKRSPRQKSSSLITSHLDLDGLTERPIEYQYASIVFATKSFKDLLGEGGFGAVYKGTLGNAKDDVHMQIAVKVLQVRSKHSRKQFFNEVAAIGRIHHVYVVRLLGFCIEENHEMLVYEYVVNGSLEKWLFHCEKGVLLWKQRYAIAVGIAKGLSYLHEECRHRIVHCDIKPQNILLDEQMCPKIADFGLAKLMAREESRVVTLARGTPGYMAPEFWMGWESHLSTKFDVYSYGMVLLELISGQQNFRDGMCFPETAFEAAMRGDLKSVIDAKLGTTDDDELDGMQVRTALLVALWCIQDHPTNRPSMSEVVQYLEGIAAIHEQPPRPTIASSILISARQQYAHNLTNDLNYDITPMSGGR